MEGLLTGDMETINTKKTSDNGSIRLMVDKTAEPLSGLDCTVVRF